MGKAFVALSRLNWISVEFTEYQLQKDPLNLAGLFH
jgi:hypothetical protein